MGRKPENNRPPKDRIPPAAAMGDPDRPAAWIVCGLLLLAVAVVFGPAIGYGLVNYDDTEYVCDNPHLAGGLSVNGVVWAFTSTRCANWHPLTWLSYLADFQLYGPAPWGYHLTNVLLHAAAAIVLFLVLRRMTGDLWPSAFVAAVFAIHPLRAESVVWVAERKDVLSGLFFMLTLAAYVGYVRRPFSFARYALVLLLFALGLMAKPMLVTLPLVLLLLDYWPLDRLKLGWRPVIEKLPLLALSAASCVATSLAQRAALARFDSLPFGSRTANALVACAAYMGQLFYPVGLAVFYPHPGDGRPIGQIAGALLLLAVITAAAAVCWRRTRPYLLVGWFWYLGMLVPVIGLVQVGQHAMADRYTYLPQIGLAIGLTWGAKQIFRAWPRHAWPQGVIAALVAMVLMGGTWRQTSYWRNSETLWRQALDCTPGNVVAYNNLGIVLREQGRVDEAAAQFQKALAIRPNDVMAHVNMGIVLYQQGRIEEALVPLQRAVDLKPDNPIGHNNLATALHALGRDDEAGAHYRKAAELQPDYMDARNNLGVFLYQCGRVPEAIAQWREVLRSYPDNTSALSQLAAVLATASDASQRNGREAVDLARRAAKLTGNQDPAILDILAAAQAEAGRFAEAVQTAKKALDLATQQKNESLAKSIMAKIGLYEAGTPFRETPQPPAAGSSRP
jgi:Tfp pilus assembly protein PilF